MMNGHDVLSRLGSLKEAIAMIAITVSVTFGVTTWWHSRTSENEPALPMVVVDIAPLLTADEEMRNRIKALSDSLLLVYKVQEFSFCEAVPPNERSEMRMFNIDCSEYERPGTGPDEF